MLKKVMHNAYLSTHKILNATNKQLSMSSYCLKIKLILEIIVLEVIATVLIQIYELG